MTEREVGIHDGDKYIRYDDELNFRKLINEAILEEKFDFGDEISEFRVAQRVVGNKESHVKPSYGAWQVIREEINNAHV